MMKIVKIAFITLALFIAFSYQVNAKTYDFYSNEETNLYENVYDESGADEIQDSVPDEFKDFSNEIELDIAAPFSLKNVFSENGLDYLINYFISYITSPMKSVAIMLLAVLICSLINSLSDNSLQSNSTANLTAVLICVVAILVPVCSLFNKALSVVSALCSFMTIFIPIFAGILIACLKSQVSVGYQSVMFLSTSVVTYLGSYVVLPFTNSFLAVNVASAVSISDKLKGLASLLKKTAFIVITGAMAVFLAVLSIQTVVAGVADTAATKSAKFFISSFIPIIGSSLSEALGSLRSCVGVLRSGVGIYAVIVILFISLPIVIEIIVYKLTLCFLSVVSEMFGVPAVKQLSDSVNSALSLILAVVLCVQIMFVFSTAILALTGESV